MHPVVSALRERPSGARIALVVEGGGMRGAVTGGMVLVLDELGLAASFDAAYGSSAGTLNAMWLVSGRVREGVPTWTDPALVRQLISPLTARLLRRVDPAVARAFLTRAEREAEDESFLAAPDPRILSVRPFPDAPVPGRLDRDVARVRAHWTPAVARCWMRSRDLHVLGMRRRGRHGLDPTRGAATRELHRRAAAPRSRRAAAG